MTPGKSWDISKGVWIGGQWFGAEVIERIKGEVLARPDISRRRLSQRVCEWLDWRDPLGRLCEGSARKALIELQRRGAVGLPKATPVANFKSEAAKADKAAIEVAQLECSLAELGAVEIVAITGKNRRESAS